MEFQKVRNPESRNMRKLLRSDRFELILFEVFNKITAGFRFLKEKQQKLQASLESLLHLLPENIVVIVLSVPCSFGWEFVPIEFP